MLSVTLKTVFDRQNALHNATYKFCFINGIALPFSILVITSTSQRPCLGQQPDQYFEVMSFLRSDKVKVRRLARPCRGLKTDKAREIVWMHLENNIVHETRSMPV